MSYLRFFGLMTTSVLVTVSNSNFAQAAGEIEASASATQKAEPPKATDAIGRLTRYAVKPDSLEDFRKALADYVSQSLTKEENIEVEAYFERDTPSVLWLIERWTNRGGLERFGNSQQSKVINSLEHTALSTNATTYYVTDLEPLSKQQWRRAASAEGHPITLMLFVDSKEGTQSEFKAAYHIAMPQFRSEPGVVTYQLSQVLGEATKFVTYEKFRSQDAFQYHLNFPPIKPVIDYLHTSIKKQPFEAGLHSLVEFAPLMRE